MVAILTTDPVDHGIINAYQTDTMAKELKDRTQEEPYIHQTPEGYIRFYGKVYVPPSEVLESTLVPSTKTGTPDWEQLSQRNHELLGTLQEIQQSA